MILLYDDNDENDDDDDNDEGLSVSREGPLQADMPSWNQQICHPVSRYALMVKVIWVPGVAWLTGCQWLPG